MDADMRNEMRVVAAGAVAVCRKPGSKYHDMHRTIVDSTKNFPEWANFAYRKWHVENGHSEPVKCGCGCGEMLRNHKKRFLSGHGNRSDEVKARKVESYKERTGYENPSQNPAVKSSKEATFLERYGAKNYMSSERGYSEYKEKMLEKTGVTNPFQREDVKQKIKVVMASKREEINDRISAGWSRKMYAKLVEELRGKFEPLFTEEEYRGLNRHYNFRCVRCGRETGRRITTNVHPRCLVCDPVPVETGSSEIEMELRSFLLSLGLPVKFNDREHIKPMELDAVFPEHRRKLAVELDGLYWHSEVSGMKGRKYHNGKLERCASVGIRLLHVFENEWRQKKRIVKSRIRNALGLCHLRIGARECEVRVIDKDAKGRFLKKYHLQGNDNSSIRYGLFYRNRMVAVMTFGRFRRALGRGHSEGSYELMRFATVSSIKIQGAAGKLLERFKLDYMPRTIISYADRRWSEGELYRSIGFRLDHVSPPNYWYTSNYKDLEYRFKYRKDVLVKSGADPKMSEWQIMKSRGYDRVWDCGNMVFEWKA